MRGWMRDRRDSAVGTRGGGDTVRGNGGPRAHPLLTISQRRCRLRAITTMVGWTRYPPGLKEKSRPSQVTFSRCL